MQSSFRVIKSLEVNGKEIIKPPKIEIINESFSKIEGIDLNNLDKYNEFLNDARKASKSIIDEAYSKAESIVNDAIKEANKIKNTSKEEGFQEGYKNGYQDGYDYGITESKKIADEIRNNAEVYLKSCTEEVEKYIKENEREIVNIALAIAKEIVNSEIKTNPEIINDIAKKVLSKVTDKTQVILKVNPSDFNRVVNKKDELSIYVENSKNLFIVADCNIPQGSAKAETPSGFIDGSIESQLEMILKNIIEV